MKKIAITFLALWSWVAVSSSSGAGGTVSLTPSPPNTRLVGLAYSTWHGSTNWHNMWGVPALGPYVSNDRAVIRKHAEWISDAGVDFIFVDWSNDVDYTPGQPKHAHLKPLEDATEILLDEFASLARRPRIALMIGTAGAPAAASDGRLQRKADQVWKTFAENPRYRPLLQEYLGKPLLIVYANTPTPYGTKLPWNDPRFTVRWMTGYIAQQPSLLGPNLLSKQGYWSWEDRGEQPFSVVEGHPECMTVVASWRADRGRNIPAAGRQGGETFRNQWARARAIGPAVTLVVSWNEWVSSEQPSPELSKDLEPSVQFGDLYLRLLKEQIVLFKQGK